ncbi:hypothetical protein [Pseudoalteromonas sp. SR41-4]|uniref:hypothetical protein n=1 Tax=Pseudoalteromonas sp. SR41-4 TaxID=2760950 RepID=UPI0016000498|nr:hypothetical protein [Pseudoalteromonas sp. SR41-4]MBB1293322.1 hypothetical protein [Pseudoalteromonas sp. SR41-4]
MLKYMLFMILFFSAQVMSSVTNWVDFELRNGKITLPVKIYGIDSVAIIDSTAQSNFIGVGFSTKHIDLFSKRGIVEIRDNRGERRVERFANVNVHIFDVDMPFKELTPINADGYDLVLGVPFFREHIVQIDYPKSRLRLISHASVDISKYSNIEMVSKREPLLSANTLLKNDPSLKVFKTELNGRSFWLTLDTTELNGIKILKDDASDLGIKMNPNEKTTIINSVKIGPFNLENVSVSLLDFGEDIMNSGKVTTGTRVEQSVESKGVIGFDILQHFIITLDFKNNYALLQVGE